MTKIFCVLILFAAIVIGGCTTSKMSVESTDDKEITISATNAGDGGGNGSIKIPEGSTLHVNAKISAGKLIVDLGDRKHTVDKTGEFFIDTPPGRYELSFSAQDGLTGEIVLRALPRA